MIVGQPGFSIVVPVYNREEELKRCIESLLALDYDSYEIIIVDNGSTDGTRDLASHYPVNVTTCEKRGAAAAMNVGIKEARNAIVAFTDSDCIVDRNWLKVLSRNYVSDDVGGVGGVVPSEVPQTAVQSFLDYLDFFGHRGPEEREVRRAKGIFFTGGKGTGNVSYRRAALLEVGGFDETMPHSYDYQMSWSILDRGYRIISDPEAVVYHRHRKTGVGMMSQLYGYGTGQIHLLKNIKEKLCYVRIKTYFMPVKEFRLRLPFRMLLTLDGLHGVYMAIIAGFFIRPLLWTGLAAMAVFFCTSLARGFIKRKKGTKVIWILAYPFLHLMFNASLSAGRLVGGLKCRVIAL
jgi:glycosyltransferase involved in cell wall biosynthesis